MQERMHGLALVGLAFLGCTHDSEPAGTAGDPRVPVEGKADGADVLVREQPYEGPFDNVTFHVDGRFEWRATIGLGIQYAEGPYSVTGSVVTVKFEDDGGVTMSWEISEDGRTLDDVDGDRDMTLTDLDYGELVLGRSYESDFEEIEFHDTGRFEWSSKVGLGIQYSEGPYTVRNGVVTVVFEPEGVLRSWFVGVDGRTLRHFGHPEHDLTLVE